ncbi:MAG: Na/Pi cotransporter family protein [Lachnospiraceae bacterium]|nr:Na/Pi cotransporter family protein [Lachnospiraceae bacterium]
MDIFSVLTMVGGLALFLYGMDTMGDGLVRLSGGKLEKILEKLTEKRIMALLLGALVTAVIQSSSATTVMVVGFVNSGIMKLTQAVGVIMGANIGTTITSWILSLAGISSKNVWIRLLKPSSFTPVLAVLGIIFLMTGKDGSKKKITGNILLGFAVLMFGMETMSGAVAPLKENEAFTGMLTAFSNPILGMIAGAVLTAVIQSSSASVGILQALCLSGVVNYSAALPIIMGQNIGTCVTALISAIGSGKNAKRASFIHLYFNLIGTVLFMAVFYSINVFVPFAFLNRPATAAGIAVIHSAFNIGCALVLFPFANGLVKFSCLTVRDKQTGRGAGEKAKDIPVLAALDERFLESPSFAMQLCRNAVVEMAAFSRQSIEKAMDVLEEYGQDKVKAVIELEQLVDRFEDVLGSYLVKLAGHDLSKKDSHLLSTMLHVTSDIERISDHAVNIAESAQKLHNQGLVLTAEGKKELKALSGAVRDILSMTIEAFCSDDLEAAAGVEPLEEVIDDLVMEMKQRHIVRLRKGICSMEAGIILEDILTNFERVSDHCSNIAVIQIKMPTDVLDLHRYVDVTLKENDQHFRREILRLKQVYQLPAVGV